jgi:hypothetical protein
LQEPLWREIVQQCEAQFGIHDPATLWSKVSLTWLHTLRGRYDLAEAEYIELIKAFESKLGENHPAMVQCKSSLALVY